MKDLEKYYDNQKNTSLKYKKRKVKRTIIKAEGKIPNESNKGIVTSIIGNLILVETNDQKEFECVTSGIIISKNVKQSILSIGDIVYFVPDSKSETNTGSIVKIEERRNHFSRKEVRYPKEDVIASNIDVLIIFMSSKSPKLNKHLIDRFLITAELNRIVPIICVNKIDLVKENKISEELQIYRNLGFQVFLMSAIYGTGLDGLLEAIKNKKSVLTGPSGTGKSTLLNRLLGGNYQSVNEISARTSKGKHTTSAVKMYTIHGVGTIIDTPGIREFGLWGMSKEEIPLYFHEFDSLNHSCKYYPCSHTHEPECAVIEALNKGEIDADRYESYLNIYFSL